jgi:hypothetical protein
MDVEKSVSPNVIRAACRGRFYDSLEHLSAIAIDPDSKAADRIRAIDTLGRFGLGAADQGAVHIHAGDGATVLGVVHLPALEHGADGADSEGPQEGPPARAGVKLLTSG